MAGEVEGRREPAPGGHIELPAASLRERGDGLDRALERLGVDRPPVPNGAEVREVVRRGAKPRRGARRRKRRRQEPEEPSAASSAGAGAAEGHRGALPQEHEGEPDDPRGGEQRLVGRDEGGRAPALVQPPAARLHHRAARSLRAPLQAATRRGSAPPRSRDLGRELQGRPWLSRWRRARGARVPEGRRAVGEGVGVGGREFPPWEVGEEVL